jgi:hypothetical protein
MSITTIDIWTYSLVNDSLTIDSSYSLGVLSILAVSGSVTITGSGAKGTLGSDSITLLEGQGLTLSVGENTRLVLTGITISTSGTTALAGR